MADLLPEQARETMLACCQTLRGREVLALQRCFGRVLAEDLKARVAHPSRRISAMDGYAVRARQARRDIVLRLVGSSAAGVASVPLLAAEPSAVQVFTGAALPNDADAVLIDEHSVVEGERVRVLEEPARGRYIRAEGGDFAEGSVCLERNRLLSLRDLTLAATMNYAWLSVRRRPRLAIVASGDELACPGEVRASHHISAANSWTVAMLGEAFGAEARVVPFARDNLGSMSAAFEDALAGSDIVVATGGAAQSAADWTGAALKELGVEEKFSRLAMRPGKPTRFGVAKGRGWDIPVLVLPGNPASVYVGAVVFLRPMLQKMLSLAPDVALREAVLACDILAGGERSHYMRAVLEGDEVSVFTDQESSHTKILAEANCLAVQPTRARAKKRGEKIGVLTIPEHCCRL